MAPVHLLCNQLVTSSKAGLARIAVPYSNTNLAIAHILYKEGLISSLATGNVEGPFSAQAGLQGAAAAAPITPATVASRRLWLSLKYRNGEPVLRRMGVVSKPSRRVVASMAECKALASGGIHSTHPTLPKGRTVGQVTILRTTFGIVELQEALAKGVGGEVLCYAA